MNDWVDRMRLVSWNMLSAVAPTWIRRKHWWFIGTLVITTVVLLGIDFLYDAGPSKFVTMHMGFVAGGIRNWTERSRTRYIVTDNFNTPDGLGCGIMRMKTVLILSMLMGFKYILNPDQMSDHGYSVSSIVNAAPVVTFPHTVATPSNGSVCYLRAYCEPYNCDLLLNTTCELLAGREGKPGGAEMLSAFTREYSRCEVVVDMVLRTRWIEEANACLQPFYQAAFSNVFVGRNYTVLNNVENGSIAIGVNIRWGDVATKNLNEPDPRTMRWADANAGVALAKAAFPTSYVLLFVKNFEERIRERLDFEFILVDSGDDIQDLAAYSRLTIKVQQKASWAVLGTFIYGNSIVLSSEPYDQKYWNSEDAGVHVFDIKNPPEADHLRGIYANLTRI